MKRIRKISALYRKATVFEKVALRKNKAVYRQSLNSKNRTLPYVAKKEDGTYPSETEIFAPGNNIYFISIEQGSYFVYQGKMVRCEPGRRPDGSIDNVEHKCAIDSKGNLFSMSIGKDSGGNPYIFGAKDHYAKRPDKSIPGQYFIPTSFSDMIIKATDLDLSGISLVHINVTSDDGGYNKEDIYLETSKGFTVTYDEKIRDPGGAEVKDMAVPEGTIDQLLSQRYPEFAIRNFIAGLDESQVSGYKNKDSAKSLGSKKRLLVGNSGMKIAPPRIIQ